MGRHTGSIRYGTKSAIKNPINLYIHGGGILSLLTLVYGLITIGSINQEVINFLIDFYLSKLLPWPLDEAYLAQTMQDFVISHLITLSVGVLSATTKWWHSMR